MLQIPIFHVNGEDPEAVAQVVNLAMDFRNEFEKDVVIDMYAYRRLGHNEGDEPRYTQPLMYAAIDAKKPVRESYLEHLLSMNELTRQEADAIAEVRHNRLSKEFELAKTEPFVHDLTSLTGILVGIFWWARTSGRKDNHGNTQSVASELLIKACSVPQISVRTES